MLSDARPGVHSLPTPVIEHELLVFSTHKGRNGFLSWIFSKISYGGQVKIPGFKIA